ncbi:hypothetical protein M0802_009553 [Mischocyttarus mexicanus]|nr:hypothetical protein M0802_009553 [Mischocyttarus mexicanus]
MMVRREEVRERRGMVEEFSVCRIKLASLGRSLSVIVWHAIANQNPNSNLVANAMVGGLEEGDEEEE